MQAVAADGGAQGEDAAVPPPPAVRREQWQLLGSMLHESKGLLQALVPSMPSLGLGWGGTPAYLTPGAARTRLRAAKGGSA